MVMSTKYRHKILEGDLQERCRGPLVQICDAENMRILKGVVGKGHVPMHVGYPPWSCVGVLVKRPEGRPSLPLWDGFPALGKQYWGLHLWAVGFGAWGTGRITDEMVQEYLEHHRDRPNSEKGNWILGQYLKRISFFV